MAGLVPIPPSVVHNSRQLTSAEAHGFLSTFLAQSEINPAYRPDSVLTQYGPQSASTGEGSNVTLNHLKRICRGMYGEYLRIQRRDTEAEEAEEELSPRSKRRKIEQEDGVFPSSPPLGQDVVADEDADGETKAALIAEELDDWQDKAEFEHAQTDLTGDLDGRDRTTEGIERRGERFEVDEPPVLNDQDKLARKEAKRARRKQDNKHRQEAKQKTKVQNQSDAETTTVQTPHRKIKRESTKIKAEDT